MRSNVELLIEQSLKSLHSQTISVFDVGGKYTQIQAFMSIEQEKLSQIVFALNEICLIDAVQNSQFVPTSFCQILESQIRDIVI